MFAKKVLIVVGHDKRNNDMNKISVYILSFVLGIFLFACQSPEMRVNRVRTSLDFDWRFIQEDVGGAEAINFNDSQWRQLDVPHDWSIEGSYDEANPSGIRGAFLPAGIGWYRKSLSIEEFEADDKFFVEFDGVYMNSDVWINGQHLGKRPYGYISFSYDLTPYLKKGKNVLAVRVDHSKAPSGRWYTGSGIYRHVWLTRTKNVYVPQWGTFVTTPVANENEAEVNLDIKIKNESGVKCKALVRSIILDEQGDEVTVNETIVKLVDAVNLSQQFKVHSPKLWSPEQPYMYSIISHVLVDNKVVDQYTTPLGIRSIELKGGKGFFLNGQSIKFKGLSNHHDAGPVGAAVPDDVLYKRLKLLKEMGCNALRTTHNPFSPTFYNMCDTMGFMVMDEIFDGWLKPKAKHDYGHYFAEWWQRDLSDCIKRDRNHPSVVMWSIGNEVPDFTAEQQLTVVDFLKKLDKTRPITQGRGHSSPHTDMAGFNGNGECKGVLEAYHEEHPDKAIVGTEMTHTLQTRGVYRSQTWYRTKDNPAPWEKPVHFKRLEPKVYKIPHLTEEEVFTGITKKYQSSYDNSIVRIGVRDDWNRVEEYDFYTGNFRWTGFDYLGESFGWPARTANFGIIDLAGFPKDHYYLYQSLWSDKPMVHLLPHWTHPGKEEVEIPVVVYTNCQSAELFLNGQSLGEKTMGKERQLVWMVPYEGGEITAVAKTHKGEVVKKTFRTAGEAAQLKLIADKETVKANRTDVVHFNAQICDKEGVMLPDANDLIEFEISGPAKLLGVENGDILDLSAHKVPARKVFKGKCLLLLQTTDATGIIEVIATSNQLKSGRIRVKVE